jgi:hypothetical protein
MDTDDLRPGNRVRVLSGTFQGFEGVLLPLGDGLQARSAPVVGDGDRNNAVLLQLNIFGRDVVMRIQPELLTRA